MTGHRSRGITIKGCTKCGGLLAVNADRDPEWRVESMLTAMMAVSGKKKCQCPTTLADVRPKLPKMPKLPGGSHDGALKVACPTCHAAPGRTCRGDLPPIEVETHLTRILATLPAFREAMAEKEKK